MDNLFIILKNLLTHKHLGKGKEERDVFIFPVFEDGQQIVFAFLAKGVIDPVHSHNEASSKLYILKGKGIAILGDKNIDYKSGQVIDLPKGVPHGYEVAEDTLVLSVQEAPIKYTK